MSKRAAIYARYSSDLQKETSIEDQIAHAKRLCEREGWSVVATFKDKEMTGRNTRRPGYQEMQAAAGRREFDVVVVEAIDRLTRKVRDALSAHEFYTFHGVELYSVQEGRQDFMRVLFTGFGAQLFSEKISDHTKRGMQGAITRKRLHSRAYGYNIREAESGSNREIDPARAAVVKRIFEEFASGRSAHAIALGLNEDRIPAPKGNSWEASTLRGNPSRQEGILRNRLYIGIASVCRTSHLHHPDTGQRKIRLTPEDMVECEIPELRIIDQDLWDRVQAELARRAAANPRQARAAHRNKYLLSGLITCGCCGAPYIISSRSTYRCRESLRKICNNKVPISRKRLESKVFATLRQTLMSDEWIRQFETALKAERAKLADGSAEKQLKLLKAALAKAQKGQENIMSAIADGAPFATFKAKSQELETEVSALSMKIAQLQSQIETQKKPQQDARSIYKQVLSKFDVLLSSPEYVEEASNYLKEIVQEVTLTPAETADYGLMIDLALEQGNLLHK